MSSLTNTFTLTQEQRDALTGGGKKSRRPGRAERRAAARAGAGARLYDSFYERPISKEQEPQEQEQLIIMETPDSGRWSYRG